MVAAVDAIAQACSPEPLSSHDLVHGNFNLANTIAAAGRLWVVDVEALGPGPRAYDLAEALLVAAEFGHGTESAAVRLWGYGAGLDRREFAICADRARRARDDLAKEVWRTPLSGPGA